MVKKDIRKLKLEDGKIIPLTFDYAFIGIFGNKKNIDIVEYFLADYLNEPLEKIVGHVKIRPRDLEIESKGEKSKQVDLILDFEDNIINIEISNTNTQGKIDRDIIYASRIHGGQLEYGEKDYTKIGTTIQIRLNNRACNKNNIVEKNYLRNKNGDILSKKFRIDNVDLVKGSKKIYNNDKVSKWCRILKAETREELERELGEVMMTKEAREKLLNEVNKYSRDKEVIALYSAYSKEELERNTFYAEMNQEKEKMKKEKQEMNQEKEKMKKEKQEMNQEKEKMKKEQQKMKKEQQKMNEEKEELKKQQERINREKEKLDKTLQEHYLNEIKNMLANGLNVKQVAQYINISEKEIYNILKSE